MITQVGKGGVLRPTVVVEEDLTAFKERAKTAEELAEFTESLLDTRIPIGRTINNVPLDRDIVLTPEILDTYGRTEVDEKIATAESSGYNPVRVNGHLLNQNVNLTAEDLDAYSAQEIDAKLDFVPRTRTVNGHPLSSDVVLAAGGVEAPTKAELDATVAGIVQEYRTVNGHPLSSDIVLTPADVGAPVADDVVPRTFTINDQQMVGDEMTVNPDSSTYTKAEIDEKLGNHIAINNPWGLGTTPKIDPTITEAGFYGYVTNHPPGSVKGTVAAITSTSTTYKLAFPEDQDSPSYYNGEWNGFGSTKAPIPDVWLPLEDSLRMITGEGPFDKVTINGSSLDLHTKSAAFTRASTATYIGKDGVLKYAAVNEPRFEKDGLLIEWQSTNHVPVQTITPSPILEVTAGQESPDGLTNGVRLKSLGMPIVIQPFTADNGPAAMSWFFKPINGTMYSALFRNSTKGVDLEREDIIISNGVATITNPNSTITKLANGWYRHTMVQPVSADIVSGDSMTAYFGLTGGDSTGREFIIFGMQIEKGPCATSYIPTAGTATTRAAESCSIQSPGNFSGKNFTLAMNASYRAEVFTPVRRKLFSASAFYTIGFEGVDSRVPTDTGGRAFIYMGQQDDSQYTGLDPLSIHSFDQTKPLVVIVDPNSRVSVYNGKAIPPVQITPTIAPGSNFFIGSDPGEWSGAHLNGHIRNVRIWLNPLAEGQIGALV